MRARHGRVRIAVIGLILVVSLTAVSLIVRSVPTESTVIGSVPIEPTRQDSSAPVAVISSERITPEKKRTVRDYLMGYYGEDWERMRATVEENLGTRLDLALEEYPIKPWEEVADELRVRTLPSADVVAKQAEAALEWDQEVLSSWDSIRAAFQNVPENMRDVELQEFRSIAEAENSKIRELALRRFSALADLCTFKWSRGEFERAPYCLPPAKKEIGGRVAVAQFLTNSSTGWIVHMPVYGDEIPPEYNSLEKEVKKAVQDRTAKLNQYLASKQ